MSQYLGGYSWLKVAFPGDSDSKESASNAGDPGSIPGSGRFPGKRHVNTFQYSEKSHGQRSLLDYSPRGHKRVGHDVVTK